MAATINIPFEMQSIFCTTAANFFISQNVGIYYTIPPQTAAPYIKVSSLGIAKQEMIDPEIVKVTFGLTIYTKGPSNRQILNIIHDLDRAVAVLLNGAVNADKTILISNAYISDCVATEVIDHRAWTANCEMVLIGGIQ